MRARDESRLQETIVAWCNRRGIKPVHVPNELVRSKAQAAIYRRMGVEPGVPDLLIFERVPSCPECRGIAFELKTGSGKTSAQQDRWLDRLDGEGWLCYVVRSKQEATEILTGLGFPADPK